MYIYIFQGEKLSIETSYIILFSIKMEKNIFNSFFTEIFVSKVSNKNFGGKTIKYINFHQDRK